MNPPNPADHLPSATLPSLAPMAGVGDGPLLLDDDQRRQQLERCLDGVKQSAAAQQEALQRGLQLTAEAVGPTGQQPAAGGAPDSSSGGEGDERRRWWRTARLRLLQHQERLQTALVLHTG